MSSLYRPKRGGETAFQKRIAWTEQEDEILKQQVARYGTHCWPDVAAGLPGRTSKACSLRWRCFLSPHIIRPSDEPFSPWEVAVIVLAQRVCGNKWNDIARHLPMRCNNDIKNHFNLYLKDKQHHVVADNAFLRQAYTLNKLLEEEPAEVAERCERLDTEKAAANTHSHALQPVKVNRGMSALIRKASTTIKPQVQPVQQHKRVPYHPYLKAPASAGSATRAGTGAPLQAGIAEQFHPQPQVFQLPRLHSNLSLGAMDSLALSAGSITGGPGSSAATAVLYSTVAAAYGSVSQTSSSTLRPAMGMLPNQLVAPFVAEQQHSCAADSEGHVGGIGQSNSFEQAYMPNQAYGGSSFSALAEFGSSNSFSNQSSGWLVALGSNSTSTSLALAVTGSEDSTVKLPNRLQQTSGLEYDTAGQPAAGLHQDNLHSSNRELLPIKLDPEGNDTAVPLSAAEEGCLLSAGVDIDPSTLYTWFSSDDGELKQQALQAPEAAAADRSMAYSQQRLAEQSGYPSSSSMHSGASSPDALQLHKEQQQQQQFGRSIELHVDIAVHHSRSDGVKSDGEQVTLSAPCTNSAAYSPSFPREPTRPQGAFHAGEHATGAAANAAAITTESGPATAAAVQQEQQAGMFTPFGQAENQQQHMQHLSGGHAGDTHNNSNNNSSSSSNNDSNSSQQYVPGACLGLLAATPNTLLQSAAAAMARVGRVLQPGGVPVWNSAHGSCGPLPVTLPGLLLALPPYQDDACEDLSDLEELLDPECCQLATQCAGPPPAALGSTQPEPDGADGMSGPRAVAIIDALEDCAELVLSDDIHYEAEDDCMGHPPLHLLPHRSGSDALDAFACVW